MKLLSGRFALLLFLPCFFIANTAQAYIVKGEFRDSISNDAEPYATLRVFYGTDSVRPVKTAVTDASGKFSLELEKAGSYKVGLSSIGKRTVERTFSVSNSSPTANLGVIYTTDDAIVLKGVDVVAQKPLVQADVDKIAYSVADDPDSKSQTAIQMLRKVPLVTVDGNDNIQVNGSSSFKVYVNGKPNTMMSNNPKEVLKSLPASTIKSIEVITDPGAKYDAEGVGGIINIVTDNARMEGYNLSVGVNGNNQGVDEYLYGTVQFGRLTLSANYTNANQFNNEMKSDSHREDYTSDAMKFLDTYGASDSKNRYNYGYLEGSFEIDTLNMITFSANMFGTKNKSDGFTNSFMRSADLAPAYSYRSLTDGESSYSSVGANANYQRSFKRKGEYLTVSYQFDNMNSGSDNYMNYDDIDNVPFALQSQWLDNTSKMQTHTMQVDYVNPINDMHYVDGGMKYIHRKNASDSKYYKDFGTGSFEYDKDLSDNYNQKHNILAFYADYQLKWKKLGFKTGVRYEHTFEEVEYAYKPERNFNTGFDDVVPSAALTYKVGAAQTVKVNYNMRINRPTIWFLNPFRDTSTPNMVSYGNPDLETEKSHSVALSFNTFSQKFNMNADVRYMFVNNGIESYSFIQDGVLNRTYSNIGKLRRVGLSLWMSYSPFANTRISVNARTSYVDFKKTALTAGNNGWNGNFYGNVQQTLPWALELSIYGGYGLPSISVQGKNSSYSYYGINLSRGFLKDKRLNVTLFGNNIFNKYQNWGYSNNTSTFRMESNSHYPTRRYGISISWRFGELKAQVKKTARSIENDDTKSGGNSGGSGNGGGQ